MRLTLQADYALRVLIYIGVKREGLATIPEIVGHFDISRGHLMKVVHRLGRTGYVETLRGREGGIRLARRAALISVGAVIRDMEPELGVLGCLKGRAGYCRIEECCVLRRALRDATNAFLAVLDRYTLADLLRPRRALARLLDLGDAERAAAAAPPEPAARSD